MTCKEAVRARGASRGHVQLSSTSFFSPSGTEVQKMPPEESGELTTGDGLHFTFLIYWTTSFSLNAGVATAGVATQSELIADKLIRINRISLKAYRQLDLILCFKALKLFMAGPIQN